MTRAASLLALGVAWLVGACGGPQTPPPPTPAPGAQGGLRPLTSRDGLDAPAHTGGATGAEVAPGAGTPAPSLPPGHPPIDRVSAGVISGTVTVAPGLLGRVAATDVLYIIARRPPGNATIAVVREESPKFPLSFELSAANVMVAGTAFTGPFDIIARLSKSGDAMAGKGDLEGTVRGVSVGAKGVAIRLDSVRQ